MSTEIGLAIIVLLFAVLFLKRYYLPKKINNEVHTTRVVVWSIIGLLLLPFIVVLLASLLNGGFVTA